MQPNTTSSAIWFEVGGWAAEFHFFFFDFFTEQTFQGFAMIWKLLAGRKQGKQREIEESWNGRAEGGAVSLLLRHVETWPPAEPAEASHHVRQADTQLSHLVSMGDEMTGNVQMGGSTNCHMKLSLKWLSKRERDVSVPAELEGGQGGVWWTIFCLFSGLMSI